MKVLMLEDDASLGQTLCEVLSKESYFVTWKRDLASTKEVIQQPFDLILFDLSLPDGQSFELTSYLPKNVPFIFMTAHSDSENRLRGFELGAHEFIPKPFHLRELLLRMKHVLEDHRKKHVNVLRLKNGITIHLEALCLKDNKDREIPTTSRDMQVLRVLIQESPAVLSREQILDSVVGNDEFPTTRTIDNSISRIRTALGDKNGEVLRSVRGIGYQWRLEEL